MYFILNFLKIIFIEIVGKDLKCVWVEKVCFREDGDDDYYIKE